MPIPRDMKPSAFRGVAFEAMDVADLGNARRIIVDEYPQRDEHNTGDIGKQTKRWRLAAFLVRQPAESWDDLQSRKRELVSACGTKGTGTLVHPTDGDFKVRCELCDVVQQAQALDYIEFSLEFVAAGSPFVASASSGQQTATYAKGLRTVVRSAYAARRGFLNMNDRVRTALTGSLTDRADAVFALAGQCTGLDVSDFRTTVATIRSAEATLVDDAGATCDAWQDAFNRLAEPTSPRNLLPSVVVFATDSQTLTATALTPDEVVSLGNAAALDTMIAMSCLSVAAERAAVETFTAYDDAIAARDAIADGFAALSPYTTDAATYAAMQDLQAAMTKAITEEAVDLPRLRTLSVTGVRAALRLAHDLYGDPERAAEIVERNHISDPGAVSGAILVLTE